MLLDSKHIWLTIALVLALLFGVYAIESKRADKAEAQAQAAQVANAQFQDQVNKQLVTLANENLALQQALAQRQVVEVQVPKQNIQLAAPQVAAGIDQAVGAKPGTTVVSGDTLILPLPLGQQALSALQLVPLLQQDKVDLTAQVTNVSKELDLEKQAHASDVNSCKLEVVALKKKGHKNIFKAVAIGIGIGIGIAFHI
jgi:hypothetical protein